MLLQLNTGIATLTQATRQLATTMLHHTMVQDITVQDTAAAMAMAHHTTTHHQTTMELTDITPSKSVSENIQFRSLVQNNRKEQHSIAIKSK